MAYFLIRGGPWVGLWGSQNGKPGKLLLSIVRLGKGPRGSENQCECSEELDGAVSTRMMVGGHQTRAGLAKGRAWKQKQKGLRDSLTVLISLRDS